MQNAQMSQAPMGARAPSPMNHPQQINMNSVSTVRYYFLCWSSQITLNDFFLFYILLVQENPLVVKFLTDCLYYFDHYRFFFVLNSVDFFI